MKFFKLIKNNSVVGVGTSYDLLKFQRKNVILISTTEADAQYIQCKDVLYHDEWMMSVTTDIYDYEIARVVMIEEEEYNILKCSLETEESILIENIDEQEQETENTIEEQPDITVEYVKDIKILEMNKQCNKSITNGFDIVLGDNEEHHFSLTIQDQLNISIALANNIDNGVIYHADGEPCKLYSKEDFVSIANKARVFKDYNIAYFNSLKMYILELSDIENISEIKYGDEIPAQFKTDVLIELENTV